MVYSYTRYYVLTNNNIFIIEGSPVANCYKMPSCFRAASVPVFASVLPMFSGLSTENHGGKIPASCS